MAAANTAQNGVSGDDLSEQTKHEVGDGQQKPFTHDPTKTDETLAAQPNGASIDPEKDAAPEIQGQSNNNAQAPAAPAAAGNKPPFMMFEVPDGGLAAWLQVAGAWSLFFNTWGNLNTFGIFQTYYEEGRLFHETSSNIAWIGAMQAFLLLLVGSLSGPLFDRGFLREQIALGSFLVIFGYMMLSLCTTFWQVILAQGFCIGIGAGFIFTPAISLLPTYFRKRLGMAVGIAASGSSMGGIIYPIVFYKLIDRIGFGWTVRVIGFISLGTLIVPNLVLKQRIKPPKARAIFDPTALRDVEYLTFVFGCFIGFIGLYVMLFYISFFGEAKGYTDQSLSFYIIPILNAASVLGRTLPNAISDIIGPLNIITPGAIICGVLIFCMIAVKGTAGVICIAVFFGFFSGVFVALPPVCFAVITKDKSKIGTRIGMGFSAISLAVLLGGPASGAILGANDKDLHWTSTWIYGGVLTVASGVTFAVVRVMRGGSKLKIKV